MKSINTLCKHNSLLVVIKAVDRHDDVCTLRINAKPLSE
jgi:hypothetical protein